MLYYAWIWLVILLPFIACDHPSPLLKRKAHVDEYAPRERTRSGVETVVVDATGASQPVVGATFSIHDVNLGFPSDSLVTVKRTSELDDAPKIRTKNETTSQRTDAQTDRQTETETDTVTETETQIVQHENTEEEKNDQTEPPESKETEPETEPERTPDNTVEIALPTEESSPSIDYAADIEAARQAQLEEELIYQQLELERQQRAQRKRLQYEMEQETKFKQEEEMKKLMEIQEQERKHVEKQQQHEREQREKEWAQEKQRQLELQQQQEQRRYQEQQQRQQEEEHRQQQEEQQRQQEEQQRQQQHHSFQEHAIVIPGTTHEIIHANPSETLFSSFLTSTLFQEVTYYNAWNLIQLGKPFVIFILCRCDRDDNWNIPMIENLIRERGMSDHFTYLYALPPIQHQFHMFQTYAIESPAIVIDNMPIGQHIEKYVFPKRLARPAEAVPQDIVQWLEDFYKDPTPLPLLIRSRPAPPPHASTDRGMVWELVGDTMTDIVMNSPYTVLLLLYSPSCPACHQIFPVFDRVAQQVSFTDPNVIIAKLDRTVNDVPFILRFHKYPTILLFRADHKQMQHEQASQQHLTPKERVNQRGLYGSHGWAKPLDFDVDYRAKQAPSDQPHDPNSCGRPYDEHELIAFVREHASKPQIASTSFSSTSALNV